MPLRQYFGSHKDRVRIQDEEPPLLIVLPAQIRGRQAHAGELRLSDGYDTVLEFRLAF